LDVDDCLGPDEASLQSLILPPQPRQLVGAEATQRQRVRSARGPGQPLGRVGAHREIAGDPSQSNLEDWTPEGQLVFRGTPGTISLVPAPGEDTSRQATTTPRTILKEPYLVEHVRVSPNGKWVAYTSVESARPRVHLASFPSFNDRRQISNDAGMQPTWRADGRELVFLGVDQRLVAVDIEADATLRVGSIKPLFQTGVATTLSVHMYAPSRDGQRFLLREPAEHNPIEQLYVVTNWLSLVR